MLLEVQRVSEALSLVCIHLICVCVLRVREYYVLLSICGALSKKEFVLDGPFRVPAMLSMCEREGNSLCIHLSSLVPRPFGGGEKRAWYTPTTHASALPRGRYNFSAQEIYARAVYILPTTWRTQCAVESAREKPNITTMLKAGYSVGKRSTKIRLQITCK